MDNLLKTQKMFEAAAVSGFTRNHDSADTLDSLQLKFHQLAKQVMLNEYGYRWKLMVEFNNDTAKEFYGLLDLADQYAMKEFYALNEKLAS